MNHWFNYEASLKILLFGLLLGSGLPALFALAVKVGATGAGIRGASGTAVAHKNPALTNPALTAISYALYALALTAVVVGVLFIARDAIGAWTGVYLLGAKPA